MYFHQDYLFFASIKLFPKSTNVCFALGTNVSIIFSVSSSFSIFTNSFF